MRDLENEQANETEKNLNKMMTIPVHSEGNNRKPSYYSSYTHTHTIGTYNVFECVISVYLILTTRKVNFFMTDADIDNVNVIGTVEALFSQVYCFYFCFANNSFYF